MSNLRSKNLRKANFYGHAIPYLEKIEIKESPFANKAKPNAPVHWIKPKVVCEVNFEEWTSDGHMRQPIFVGLRPDKAAKAVHRELPKSPK